MSAPISPSPSRKSLPSQGRDLERGSRRRPNRNARKLSRTQKMQRFLVGIKKYGVLLAGVDAAHSTRKTINLWLATYPGFKAAYDDALADYREHIQISLVDDAEKGDPITLRFIARGEFPEKYGDRWPSKKDEKLLSERDYADQKWRELQEEAKDWEDTHPSLMLPEDWKTRDAAAKRDFLNRYLASLGALDPSAQPPAAPPADLPGTKPPHNEPTASEDQPRPS